MNTNAIFRRQLENLGVREALEHRDQGEDEEYRLKYDEFRYNGGQHPEDPPHWLNCMVACVCGCGTALGYREDVIGTEAGTVIAGHAGTGRV